MTADLHDSVLNPSIPACWRDALAAEFRQPYMSALADFLRSESEAGRTICPAPEVFFAALARTPLAAVKAVIIGQDPYHGPGQAHGLSFSVLPGIRTPPSLRNILAELRSDTGVAKPSHGCLASWADNGVLLLNSVLSVGLGAPASHARQGWERFTDAVVRTVDARPGHAVFVLWGSYAQRKASFVDRTRHAVIESSHPSPLSVRRGFSGSKPFSRANAFLRSTGGAGIDWSLV